MHAKWESVEWRPVGEGVKLTATEAGVIAVWGGTDRTLTPSQARSLAEQLTLAASAAELRGAKDWMVP